MVNLPNILPINVVGTISGTTASGTPTSIFSRAAVQNVVIVTENPLEVELIGGVTTDPFLAATGTFSQSLTISGLPVATSDDVTILQTAIDAVEASDVDALTVSGGPGAGGTIDFVGFGGTNISRSGQTITITSSDVDKVGITAIVQDTSPTLGNDLDANLFDIAGIHELTAATGTFTNSLTVSGLPVVTTAQVGITAVVEDTTPQLGGDLDALGNDISNIGVLEVDTSATVTGSNVITLGDIDTIASGTPGTSLIGIASLNDVDEHSTLQGNIDIVQSAGHTSGGVISSGTSDNTVDVSSGEGYIRKDDDHESRLMRFTWDAIVGTALSVDNINYLGIEYNAGSPQAVLRTSYNWNLHQEFPLGNVVSVSGILHIENAPHEIEDSTGLMVERLFRTLPRKRDEFDGGLILSESADNNRNIIVSTGAVWDRLTKFIIPAFDSSGSDAFDAFHFDGGTFQTEFGRTTWPNTQFNDVTSGLVTMTNNRYAVLWFYLDTDGSIDMVYGTAQYNSEAAAEDEGEPSVPNVITAQGLLIGRLIFQKSATIAALVEIAFETAFAGSLATDHGNLAGLSDDDHLQYSLVDGTRAFTGNISHGGNDITSVGTITATTVTGTTILAVTSGTFTNGLNVPQFAADPSTSDGDVWINTTTSGIRWQVNSTKFEIQGTPV